MSLYFAAPFGVTLPRGEASILPTSTPSTSRGTRDLVGRLFQPAVPPPQTQSQADLQKQLDELERERALAEAEAAGAEAMVPEEKSKLPIILAVGGAVLLIGIVLAVKGRKSVAGYRRKHRRSRRRR